LGKIVPTPDLVPTELKYTAPELGTKRKRSIDVRERVALQSTSTGWLCTMRTQEERNSLREQEGTAVHLKDLLSFEKADDLVEKWSSLDETLQ